MKTQHTITNKKGSELKFPIFLAVLSPQHEFGLRYWHHPMTSNHEFSE
jgi:hypothetical protein